MQKLFSTLYGSSLFGTTTDKSDRDVKHIVLPSLQKLLLGHALKRVVNKTNQAQRKNGPEDVDEEFIPVQDFARDFLYGQTYAMELAYAADYNGAEQVIHYDRFRLFCRELRERFLTRDLEAMVSHAQNQATLYSLKGERLNAALALQGMFQQFIDRIPFDYCMSDYSFELTREAQKLAELYPESIAVTNYDANGKGDMRPCLTALNRIFPYSASFKYNHQVIDKVIHNYGARVRQAAKAGADLKAAMHAIRVVDEAQALVSQKALVFPYESHYAEYLLAIRRGDFAPEDVHKSLSDRLTTLRNQVSRSGLPQRTPELVAELEAWLWGWLKEFYGLAQPKEA